MENHLHHIRWPPLNATIFNTHVRKLRNRCYANGADCSEDVYQPGLEVIKLEFILRLKIKRNDWLLASSQSLRSILSLRMFSGFITSRLVYKV